jgi:hypothetical protein
VGLKVLAGQGANLDTTTANGRLIFGIFAALAEFEIIASGPERVSRLPALAVATVDGRSR